MGIHKQGLFYWVAIVLSALILSGCGGGDQGTGNLPEVNAERFPEAEPELEGVPDTKHPSYEKERNTGRLIYRFHRDKLPANSPRNAKKRNEEIVGRPFLLSLYRLSNNGIEVEDVTEKVSWTVIDESCSNLPCYNIDDTNKIIGSSEGSFSLEASYNNEFSAPILFETKGQLQVCGEVDNTDKTQQNGSLPCLHIIEGKVGAASLKWFTEPPRGNAMFNILRYEFDPSSTNKGYSYAGFQGTPYATFVNTGALLGQYARYCADLAQIQFNGRNNWRRATKPELDALLSNQNIVDTYGWNNQGFFSTSTMAGTEVEAVHFSDGQLYWNTFARSEKLLTTCVSQP